jgi:hypothetical protein
LKTAVFPINTTLREARKAINENRKTSLETNPPPPNIIREPKNAPGRRIRMFAKRTATFSVFEFIVPKIKLDYRKSSL